MRRVTFNSAVILTALALTSIKSSFAQTADIRSPEQYTWNDSQFQTWIEGMSDDVLTQGNQVDLLVHGEEYFPVRLELIENAKRSIDVATFLWRDDEAGLVVAKALARAARRGVQVRVVFDAFNYEPHMESVRVLWEARIPVIKYNPLTWGDHFDKRVHEKIMVVDGNVALIGGANLCSEYMVATPKRVLWHDLEVRVSGPIASRIQKRFDETWNWMAETGNAALARQKSGDVETPAPRYRTFSKPTFTTEETTGNSTAIYQYQQGYWKPQHSANYVRMFSELIRSAEKQVIFYAGYFIPNPELEQALLDAARSGVEVSIFTNSAQTNGLSMPAAGASFTHYVNLLSAGARIYEIHDRPIHTKAFLVDERFLSVGSHNFTHRAFKKNGEANVMTNDPRAIAKFQWMAARDRREFREVTFKEALQNQQTLRGKAFLFFGKWAEMFF